MRKMEKMYEANIKLVDENKWLKHDLEIAKNRLNKISELLEEYIKDKKGNPNDDLFIPTDNVDMAYKISKGMNEYEQ